MSRFVVCALGGDEDRWRLPASSLLPRTFAYGGEQSLYETAAALVLAGHEVELRGWIAEGPWRRVCERAGAWPTVDHVARRPDAGDVVVIAEGERDPLRYLRLVLSPARLVLLALAPTGLLGWPFTESWTPPSPDRVPIDALGRPEHLRAANALGFTIWTNMAELAQRGDAAGVPVRFLGRGWPRAPGPEVAKTVDVAFLAENRWSAAAAAVAAELGGLEIDAVPAVSHEEALARIGRARVLLWPSRVEGEPRVAVEARAQGTVPVALATNPFAGALDEDHGVVPVGATTEMAAAVRELLGDRDRWARLARRARETAARDVDWEAFAGRVAAAAAALPDPRVAAPALAGLGAAVGELLAEDERRAEEITVAGVGLREAAERAVELETELAAVRGAREQAEAELDVLRRSRSVRAAVGAARLLGRGPDGSPPR